MPKRRYKRREPSHEWPQIQPLLKDTAQIHYEIIRLVVLRGQTPKERGAETGVSPRTIYYRANLFDEAGMASLLQPLAAPHSQTGQTFASTRIAARDRRPPCSISRVSTP